MEAAPNLGDARFKHSKLREGGARKGIREGTRKELGTENPKRQLASEDGNPRNEEVLQRGRTHSYTDALTAMGASSQLRGRVHSYGGMHTATKVRTQLQGCIHSYRGVHIATGARSQLRSRET